MNYFNGGNSMMGFDLFKTVEEMSRIKDSIDPELLYVSIVKGSYDHNICHKMSDIKEYIVPTSTLPIGKIAILDRTLSVESCDIKYDEVKYEGDVYILFHTKHIPISITRYLINTYKTSSLTVHIPSDIFTI